MILPMLGVLLVFIFWFAILKRWQRGVVMLLAYLPFAGVVTLSFYPESYPILFKDFFFVIPAYLAFWTVGRDKSSPVRVPQAVRFAMLALAVLVLAQSFNPELENLMVAAIGAKIWLFYLPLVYLAFELIRTRDDLVRLLRLMVALTWVPCTVGIVEWVASMSFGYQETMYAIYGDAAEGATQNFAVFSVGGEFYRIPSTFTFVAQYFAYTLAMVVPAYALSRLDDSGFWRQVGWATMWLAVLASFMSGARAAYLFMPMLLFFIYGLERGFTGAFKIAIMLPPVLFAALYFAGISPGALFDLMRELLFMYSSDIAVQGLEDAIDIAPLGTGTGMNTGAARYALADPESMIGIENYYAKAVVELGVIGLMAVVGLFIALLVRGYGIQRGLRDPGLRSCAIAILAFLAMMVLNSFKGWLIDLDPINVYFWLFAGILLKLGHLEATQPTANTRETATPRHARVAAQRL